VLHRIIWSWSTGRWWVGCYISYSEEGTGRGRSSPRPLLVVPNVTAHPSTAVYQSLYWCIIVRCSAVLMCPLRVNLVMHTRLWRIINKTGINWISRPKNCLAIIFGTKFIRNYIIPVPYLNYKVASRESIPLPTCLTVTKSDPRFESWFPDYPYPDPHVHRIAAKIYWIHCLVCVSHFYEFRKKRSVTVWEILINLFCNGRGSGKVFRNPHTWPHHHWKLSDSSHCHL